MGIVKNTKKRLQEAERDNARLRAELATEKEKTAFVALLACDVDIDALMEEGDHE